MTEKKVVKKAVEVPLVTPTVPTTQEILEARGKEYGEFAEHARITQNIKAAYKDSPNWNKLPTAMKEALEMNDHKVGRILNGNMANKDSWQDIEGYTKLVSDTL